MNTDLPAGVTAVVNKAGDGWTHRVQVKTGVPVEFSVLGEEDGEGVRHREARIESTDSIGVRFSHPDGRAAVALWVRREGWTCAGRLGVRWWKATTVKAGTRPPLLVLAGSLDPTAGHAVALLSVVLRWSRRSYGFDSAQRGRHPDENVPVTLNATELGAYLSDEREDED
jgi:hypothetical protein